MPLNGFIARRGREGGEGGPGLSVNFPNNGKLAVRAARSSGPLISVIDVSLSINEGIL